MKDSTLEMLELLRDLGPVERRILLGTARRLRHGQAQYGLWPEDDKRPLVQETLEEVQDGLMYVARLLDRAS